MSIPGYTSIHQPRAVSLISNHAGGGVCVFIHNSLNFKSRSELSINNADCESLTIEIINKTIKIYWSQPCIDNPLVILNCSKVILNLIFQKLMKHKNKHIYIAGDLNFNLLDYSTNKKVKSFVDTLFTA